MNAEEPYLKRVVLVKPSRGTPSIHHFAADTAAVRQCIETHGWKETKKLVDCLTKKGYVVEVRDFGKKGSP